MFSTSGYFRGLICPYYSSGLCERPYCHFKHVQHSERPVAYQSSSLSSTAVTSASVAQSVVTQRQNSNETSHTIGQRDTTTHSGSAPKQTATYVATPREQLAHRSTAYSGAAPRQNVGYVATPKSQLVEAASRAADGKQAAAADKRNGKPQYVPTPIHMLKNPTDEYCPEQATPTAEPAAYNPTPLSTPAVPGSRDQHASTEAKFSDEEDVVDDATADLIVRNPHSFPKLEIDCDNNSDRIYRNGSSDKLLTEYNPTNISIKSEVMDSNDVGIFSIEFELDDDGDNDDNDMDILSFQADNDEHSLEPNADDGSGHHISGDTVNINGSTPQQSDCHTTSTADPLTKHLQATDNIISIENSHSLSRDREKEKLRNDQSASSTKKHHSQGTTDNMSRSSQHSSLSSSNGARHHSSDRSSSHKPASSSSNKTSSTHRSSSHKSSSTSKTSSSSSTVKSSSHRSNHTSSGAKSPSSHKYQKSSSQRSSAQRSVSPKSLDKSSSRSLSHRSVEESVERTDSKVRSTGEGSHRSPSNSSTSKSLLQCSRERVSRDSMASANRSTHLNSSSNVNHRNSTSEHRKSSTSEHRNSASEHRSSTDEHVDSDNELVSPIDELVSSGDEQSNRDHRLSSKDCDGSSNELRLSSKENGKVVSNHSRQNSSSNDHKSSSNTHRKSSNEQRESTDHKTSSRDAKDSSSNNRKSQTEHRRSSNYHRSSANDHRSSSRDHRSLSNDHKDSSLDDKSSLNSHGRSSNDHRSSRAHKSLLGASKSSLDASKSSLGAHMSSLGSSKSSSNSRRSSAQEGDHHCSTADDESRYSESREKSDSLLESSSEQQRKSFNSRAAQLATTTSTTSSHSKSALNTLRRSTDTKPTSATGISNKKLLSETALSTASGKTHCSDERAPLCSRGGRLGHEYIREILKGSDDPDELKRKLWLYHDELMAAGEVGGEDTEEREEGVPAKKMKLESGVGVVRKPISSSLSATSFKSGMSSGSDSERATTDLLLGRKRVAHNKRPLFRPAMKLPSAQEAVQRHQQQLQQKLAARPTNGNASQASSAGGVGGATAAISQSAASTAPGGSGFRTRIAHKPKQDVSIPRPVITAGESSNVPQLMRQTTLNRITDECVKLYDSVYDAHERAVNEEKAIHERSNNRNTYQSLIVGVIRRLREEGAAEKASKPSEHDSTARWSHEAVLGGAKAATTSFTVNRRGKAPQPSDQLSKSELYEALLKYLMTAEELTSNSYPREVAPGVVSIKLSDRDLSSPLSSSSNPHEKICCRCGKRFVLLPNGSFVKDESCSYHWGKAWKKRVAGTLTTQYTCCQADSGAVGCQIAKSHVHDKNKYTDLEGYVSTKPPTSTKSSVDPSVYAIDCEMIYTTHGCELARVTVIDRDCSVVLDELVRPDHTILDPNTRFSGLTLDVLDKVTTSLHDIHCTLLKLFNSKTILIGHSLESDLTALKMVHDTVVDTSMVFPHKLGLPFKRALRNVVSETLMKIIQNDVGGHDSTEDALSCMELMIWKVKDDRKKSYRHS